MTLPDGSPLPQHSHPAMAGLDPTLNVIALLQAASERQDALREAEAYHVRDLLRLRAEMYAQREAHAQELRKAEAARIDAIRAVDVGAVNRAAEVASEQAATLATQVAVSADTLRNQVAAAAVASTSALSAALEPIQKDIADLRKAQYEAQGQKTQIVDSRSGASITWAIAAVVVATLFGLIGAVGIVATAFGR